MDYSTMTDAELVTLIRDAGREQIRRAQERRKAERMQMGLFPVRLYEGARG